MQSGRSVLSWLQIPSRRGECKTRQATTILAQGETKAERPWLHSATDVAVVESADLRHCHDIAALGLLDRAWLGRVLPESEMRARGVIVAEVIAKATTEVPFVQHDHVVRSSRLMVPITRSAKGFCHGERGVARTSARPMAFTPCRDCLPKVPSRSRMRNRGDEASGKASTTCCAVQAAVGESVTLKCTTRRR